MASLYTNHILCLVFRKRLLIQCPQLFCCCMFIFVVEGESFVTGGEWSQRDQRRTCMGFNSVSNDIAGLLYSSYTLSCIENEAMAIFTMILLLHIYIWHLFLHAHNYFCFCMFTFVVEAIIYHWWWMEWKWPKKDRYEYQKCVKWYSWSIDHTQCPVFRKRPLLQCPELFSAACLFLTLRPSSVIDNEYSQMDWRRRAMGIISVSNGIAGLYWSYFMSGIQKKALDTMPRTMLLLHVYIWHQADHHLSLVMNRVKVTEERQVAMGTNRVYQMVYLV
jgi:hypothetical protein